ncbi:MAG TPA: hypothetical protein VGF44_16165 [Terriglobales bacterium]
MARAESNDGGADSGAEEEESGRAVDNAAAELEELPELAGGFAA